MRKYLILIIFCLAGGISHAQIFGPGRPVALEGCHFLAGVLGSQISIKYDINTYNNYMATGEAIPFIWVNSAGAMVGPIGAAAPPVVSGSTVTYMFDPSTVGLSLYSSACLEVHCGLYRVPVGLPMTYNPLYIHDVLRVCPCATFSCDLRFNATLSTTELNKVILDIPGYNPTWEYSIDWGDGIYGYHPDNVHVYPTSGKYTVCVGIREPNQPTICWRCIDICIPANIRIDGNSQ